MGKNGYFLELRSEECNANFRVSLDEVTATLTKMGLKDVKSQNTEVAAELVLLLCPCSWTQSTDFVIYPQEHCSDKNELPLEFCNSRAEGLPSFTGIRAALNLGEGTLDVSFESKEGTRLPFTTGKYSLNSTRAWPVAISMLLSAWALSPVFGGSGRMWCSPTSYPRFDF